MYVSQTYRNRKGCRDEVGFVGGGGMWKLKNRQEGLCRVLFSFLHPTLDGPVLTIHSPCGWDAGAPATSSRTTLPQYRGQIGIRSEKGRT